MAFRIFCGSTIWATTPIHQLKLWLSWLSSFHALICISGYPGCKGQQLYYVVVVESRTQLLKLNTVKTDIVPGPQGLL